MTVQPNIVLVHGAWADSGSWNGFAALLAPNNNPYGTFAEAFDSVQAAGGSAQNAAKMRSAFAKVSSYSEIGSDKAVTPPPA